MSGPLQIHRVAIESPERRVPSGVPGAGDGGVIRSVALGHEVPLQGRDVRDRHGLRLLGQEVLQ